MSDHRAKRLGQARADLAQLPELIDELARCLTEKGDTLGNGRTKVIGSPPPLRLDVLHLVDVRRKPDWEGADPRYQAIDDRYGATATLEAWTRVVWEEKPEPIELNEYATVRSEAAILLEVWDWITEQQWADELATDVTGLTRQVRAALGIRPEYRPRCRKCGYQVVPVDDHGTLTSWESCAYGKCTGCEWTYPTGPALAALGQVQDPMPLSEIAGMTGVPLRTLQRWAAENVIVPTPNPKSKQRCYDLAAVRKVANSTFGRQVS